MLRLELRPHDPAWAGLAEAEAARFMAAAGAAVIRVEHIGSTSIPSIVAKPVLDLMPLVADIAAMDAARMAIEAAGYGWRGEYGLPGRRYCYRDEDGMRVAQFHCYAEGTSEAERHLAFRDYLRGHPAIARVYAAQKLQCLAQHPADLSGYMDCKDVWIKRTEAEALKWARSIRDG